MLIEFVRQVIEKDRRGRGAPLTGLYTAEEMGNACASLSAVLLAAAPFESRLELLTKFVELARRAKRCPR